MKLLIDNDPGFEVTLRTEDGRATVKIPIRKGGFENDEIALLAAARFRAREEMYQALRAAVDAHDAALASSLKYAEARGEIVHIIEPEWVAQARAALAMADNTNENLSL